VVSAIRCNGRSASPGVLAMARRISALAVWWSRAVRSRLFSLAISDLGLPDSRLLGFGAPAFGRADLGPTDLRLAIGLARLGAIARFSAFRPRVAIFSIPNETLANPGAGV
jgi:hypothetical protein